MSVLGGCVGAWDSPKFGGDAYTEIVEQLSRVNAASAWIAAAILFAAGGVLKALADILEELRLQAPPPPASGTPH